MTSDAKRALSMTIFSLALLRVDLAEFNRWILDPAGGLGALSGVY